MAAVLSLLVEDTGTDLLDRKVRALQRVADSYSAGFALSDLPAVRDVFAAGFRALEEHGAPFVAPLCRLLSAFGQPYTRSRSREEVSYHATLCDVLRMLVAVLVWDDLPDIQTAAANALEAFTRAEGFEEQSVGGGGRPATTTDGVWRFHQRLLLDSEALGGLLMALRHHLAVFAEVSGHGERVPPPAAAEARHSSTEEGEEDGDGPDEREREGGETRETRGDGGRTAVPPSGLGVTYAVRAAGVPRSPELANTIARIVRDASETPDAAVALVRLGAPGLVMSIFSLFAASIRDPLLAEALEILWNLLEANAATFGAASIGGDPAHAAISLAELFDKHRSSNTVRQLGNTRDLATLGLLLESAVSRARTRADKEFRNDVLMIVSLLTRKQENRPLMASAGILTLLLDFSTAPEIVSGPSPRGQSSALDPHHRGAGVIVPTDRYATCEPVDIEFKAMCWTMIVTLSQGLYAESEVTAPGEEEDENGRTTSCLALVQNSTFIPALLAHLDPALAVPVQPGVLLASTHSGGHASPPPSTLHPYLACLPPAARRSLGMFALDILTTLAPKFGPAIVRAGGLEVLSLCLRTYTDVLNGTVQEADLGRTTAPPSPTRVSQRQQKLLRVGLQNTLTEGLGEVSEGGLGGMTTTLLGSGRPAVPFRGLHDTGRQYGALRLLHALMEVGAMLSPSAHLSAMLSAGVPTVVASRGTAEVTAVRGEGGEAPLGHRVAARLGELGFAEDCVSILRAMPAGSGSAEAEGSAAGLVPRAHMLTNPTFGQTWAGATGDGGLQKKMAVAAGTGYGPGVTAVTGGAFLDQGRSIVPFAALKEELLACFTGLTRGAADAVAAAAARGMRDIADPPAGRELQAAAQAVRAAAGETGEGEGEGTGEIAGGSSASLPADILSALVFNQERIRKAGGVSALLREVAACVKEAADRAGGEWSTSGTQPRVATVAVTAVRSTVSGNVRSEARFLADSGVDALLDLAEVAAPTLRPVVLTALADLCRNSVSHVCMRAWRSHQTGASAGVLLLDLWRAEERRLGVKHESGSGAVANVGRALDGSDAASRQLALFGNTHKATAASVMLIRPGGRTDLVQGAPGSARMALAATMPPAAAAPEPAEEDSALRPGETAFTNTTAFRALRSALRSAKLWKQVESDPAGGPISSLVSGMDLRHKLYACLQSIGFNDLPQAIAEADMSHTSLLNDSLIGRETDGKGGEDEAEDFATFQASVYSTGTTAAQGGGVSAPPVAFPDLRAPHLVTLELARAYPDFVRGAAWDDVNARLIELNKQPLPQDAELLAGHLEVASSVAARVRDVQLVHSATEAAASAAREAARLKEVIKRKHDEAAALMFNEQTKRKPGAAQGKAFAGLNLEEKKAGTAARAAMIERSYVGYVKPEALGQPTDDGVPWRAAQ